jgi:tetratricopeptide (TPR) repeat protein
LNGIGLNPNDNIPYGRRATVWSIKGEYAKALADYIEASRINPSDATYHNNHAWILATCPDIQLRDGRKAVDIATRACELSGWKAAYIIDTLAAAYAEAGEFASAVKWQSKAVELAPRSQSAEIRFRLGLYQQNTPFREQASSPDRARDFVERGNASLEAGNASRAITEFTVAIHLAGQAPMRSRAHEERAQAWLSQSDYAAAVADFQSAARLDSNNPVLWDAAARILATCSDDAVRDGKLAVQCALTACELTRFRNADYIDTLAAAYAETGQFRAAAAMQRKAIEAAADALKADFRKRLELYESEMPFRTGSAVAPRITK